MKYIILIIWKGYLILSRPCSNRASSRRKRLGFRVAGGAEDKRVEVIWSKLARTRSDTTCLNIA